MDKEFSRRKFLALGAGVGSLGILIANNILEPEANNDMPSSREAEIIARAILYGSKYPESAPKVMKNHNLSHWHAYNLLDGSIENAEKYSKTATTNEGRETFAKLEILGRMYRARIARTANTNIVWGKELHPPALPEVLAPKPTPRRDLSYNLMSAMEDYARVLDIHNRSSLHELRGNVGFGLGNSGIVASRQTVNQRMRETIESLLKTSISNDYRDSVRKYRSSLNK